MRSSWINLVLSTVVVVMLAGICSAGPTTLKLATVESTNIAESPALAAATVFKSIVESRTGGSVLVNLHPGQQLGNERELIEGLRLGTVEMAITSDGPVGGFFEPILVLGIPYAFPNTLVAWKVLDGPFGKSLMEEMRKKTGIRCLAITENGFRHFTNNRKVIKTPADMEGLKVRTMENPTHMAIVRSLGANPTPISFGELYSALQQGTVDGQENPIAVLYMIKGYEVQKYLTLDGHVYNPSFIWINDQVFEKMDAPTRVILQQAAVIANFVKRSGVAVAEATKLGEMGQKGMKVYQPTPEELAQFKAKSQGPVIAELKKVVDPQWIDKMFAAIKAAEQE